jgi:hypothetical protein
MSDIEPSATPIERLHPGLHRLVLLPLLGMVFVIFVRLRARGDEAKRELTEALMLQGLALGVVGLHLVLQLAIEGTRWLWLKTVEMGMGMEDSAVPSMLLIGTALNVGAGLAEWGVLAYVGLRAAGGAPYPGRGARREIT